MIGQEITRGGFTWRVTAIDGDAVTVEAVGHGFTRVWTLADLEPPTPDFGPVDDVDDEDGL